MIRAHVKPCFATIALLAAILLSEHLRAGQSSLDKAESLLSKGATDDALVVLRQIVADDPRNVDARLLLGTALALRGERGESIHQMAVAAQLRPDSAGVHIQVFASVAQLRSESPFEQRYSSEKRGATT